MIKQTAFCILVTAASLAAQEHLCVRDLAVPYYAPLARMARLQGKVVLDIQVLADGHVGDVKASGAEPLLQQEAEKNIRKWTFGNLPQGSKFPIYHRIVYVYRLEGKPTFANEYTYVFHLPDYVEIVTQPPAQTVN